MSGADNTDALLRRALVDLKKMRARLEAMEQAKTEPIAIIGAGCRFPGGASNLERFWAILRDGVDTITDVPAERWDANAIYDPDISAPGKAITRWGGFLEGVDQFDPGFFRLSTREAAAMDPQQRLLLEVCWEAFENAGIHPERVAGTRTGVFVGLFINDFLRLLREPPARGGSGVANSLAANRISYFFDLQGPSIVIDTACSSALAALDFACESLRNGTSNMALAGGVNIILSPDIVVSCSQAGMMAADGRCKTFDARGDGYVRSEGCGIVILKRLSNALADGDNILALIRSSAVNHNGQSNGLTAPSVVAQRALIQSALEKAKVSPGQISLIEAHGTGTSLGDPIEIEALNATYGKTGDMTKPCFLGSVKTNVGHSEAAAGIVGLIKTVLCFQHEAIPPHLHFRNLNPNISLDGTRFRITTEGARWPRGNEPRFAALSSFGVGGTNLHVILEEAPLKAPPPAANIERPQHILALSARSEAALRVLAGRYAQHIAAHPDEPLGDLCHTANTTRASFPFRLAAQAPSSDMLRTNLESFARSETTAGISVKRVVEPKPKIAFLFTGQGSQCAGMGKTLYDTQPVFRQTLDQCAEILRPILDRPLVPLLYAAEDDSLLDETGYAQPALFAIEYALATLWRSWGVEPDAVMGHSVGEYVAACVAGISSLEDGLRFIAERARLMQALPRNGTMVLVTEEESVVRKYIGEENDAVDIAALNAPKHTVISGSKTALETILSRLEADFIHTEELRVSHAFHSRLLDPMLEPLERFAQSISWNAPRIPLFSNLTGQALSEGSVMNAAYVRRHARSPVLFQKGLETMRQQGYSIFLEIGPHDVLSQLGRKNKMNQPVTFLPSLVRKSDDWQTLLQSVATLHTSGVAIDWAGFDRPYSRRRLALPTYPFERRRCWPEPSEINSPYQWPNHEKEQTT